VDTVGKKGKFKEMGEERMGKTKTCYSRINYDTEVDAYSSGHTVVYTVHRGFSQRKCNPSTIHFLSYLTPLVYVQNVRLTIGCTVLYYIVLLQ
jgi:hypothetical protein